LYKLHPFRSDYKSLIFPVPLSQPLDV